VERGTKSKEWKVLLKYFYPKTYSEVMQVNKKKPTLRRLLDLRYELRIIKGCLNLEQLKFYYGFKPFNGKSL